MEFPKFQGTDNGVNELDLKKQETRSDELLCLKGEARNLREAILQKCYKGSATNFRAALDTIDGYLKRMKDLCVEPQNSMPDVVIWMIAGSKRIAYYRIQAYELLYSENPDARGRMCANLQNFIMKVRMILSLNCLHIFSHDISLRNNACMYIYIYIYIFVYLYIYWTPAGSRKDPVK